jgi:hypothetical protein
MARGLGPISCSLTLLFAAATLPAADPSWKDKSIPQWNDQDAKEVLANSPWVKNVKLDQVRNLSKFERRDGGDWEAGIGPTVGVAGFSLFGLFDTSNEALAFERAHARPDLGSVLVRWESALPVRSAEVKIGAAGVVPMWEGDYYAIAVYNVLTPFRWNMDNELKRIAFLKRDNQKDLKPARVLILRHDTGLATLVYLFSRSAEITKNDHRVQFVAQIGRLFLSQDFFPDEMQFESQPEL